MRVLQSIEDSALSIMGYVETVEDQAERAVRERDLAREEAARARFVSAQDGSDSEELYEMAVREYVVRRMHKGFSRDQVRKITFGPGDPWPGTDVTPGDDMYSALCYEWTLDGKTWNQADMHIEQTPAELVQKCLRILAELKAQHG